MSDLTASAVRISLLTVVIVPPMRKVGRFPLERWKSDAFLVTISRKYRSSAGIGWNKAGPMPRKWRAGSGEKRIRACGGAVTYVVARSGGVGRRRRRVRYCHPRPADPDAFRWPSRPHLRRGQDSWREVGAWLPSIPCPSRFPRRARDPTKGQFFFRGGAPVVD